MGFQEPRVYTSAVGFVSTESEGLPKGPIAGAPVMDRSGLTAVGIVGLGPRAEVLQAAFLQMDEVAVVAVCDLQQPMIDKTLGIFAKYGKPAPKTFLDYHQMLKLET